MQQSTLASGAAGREERKEAGNWVRKNLPHLLSKQIKIEND